ncbi:thermonuclease family protein [Ostreibacterium oceani]|uniref:TNase-like domain-containing protein n=1 Tax=Ostreibacterium oceani TaxID=2654998 RepID=A0A6N7EXU6_9GAMM|nr:thermonuclease family protein [Ostreibacterium oceani]MPV86209.1 hypothetical protein [Ostreibacterium oceani]
MKNQTVIWRVKAYLLSHTSYLLLSSLLVIGIVILRGDWPQKQSISPQSDNQPNSASHLAAGMPAERLGNGQLSNEQLDNGLPRQQWMVCYHPVVLDGDSLRLDCAGQVIEIRIMDIDAPELAQSPWGGLAKSALVDLLAPRVDVKIIGLDAYQRHLGKIKVNNQDVGLGIVKLGMATVYPRYQPPPEYIVTMRQAKQQAVGIWQTAGLHQDPQRFRRLSDDGTRR